MVEIVLNMAKKNIFPIWRYEKDVRVIQNAFLQKLNRLYSFGGRN